MSFGGNPPAPPNPGFVASAQQQASISVAIANAKLVNANEDTPESTVTYTETGTYSLIDPQYDATGVQVGTTTRSIPITTRTVAYKAQPQRIFEKNLNAREALNDFAVTQTTQLNTTMTNPFSLAGLPVRGAIPTSPTFNDTIPAGGAIISAVPIGDLVTHHATVRDAIDSRLQYQITIDRTDLITNLANNGIVFGMEAYDRAMFDLDRQTVDARNQSYLSAAQEQTRIVQLELMKMQAANEAQGQAFQQAVLIIDFSNSVASKRFDAAMALNNYIDSIREDSLKEKVIERTQVLNELSTIVHGGQVQIPQFQPFRGGTATAAPIADAIYSSYGAQQQNYLLKKQQQNDMFGGIFGLAANLIGGGALG